VAEEKALCGDGVEGTLLVRFYGILFIQRLCMYGGNGETVFDVGLAVILLQVLSVAKDDICMYQNTIFPHSDQSQKQFPSPSLIHWIFGFVIYALGWLPFSFMLNPCSSSRLLSPHPLV